MRVQLDASAMAALFPEGSDARLELQAAVIDEFVRRIVKKEYDVNAQLAVTKLVREEFATCWQGGKFDFSASVKTQLKEALDKIAKGSLDAVLLNAVGRASPIYAEYERNITKAAKTLTPEVKEYIDLSVKRAQEADIQAIVDERVQAALKNIRWTAVGAQ